MVNSSGRFSTTIYPSPSCPELSQNAKRAADEALSRALVWIACITYLAGYAGYCFSEALGPVRYLVYAVPPILVISLMFASNSTGNKAALVFLVGYLWLASMWYLVGIKRVDFFLNEFVIMALIITCFVPMINVDIFQIRVVFICSIGYFALAYSLTEHGGVRLFQILESGTGSGMESGFDNHQGGLLGPIYAVFMYAIGAKIQFVLALVMSLLGGKRVGVIAILIGLAAVFVFRRAAILKQRHSRFLVLLGILVVINLAASNLIIIAEYLHSVFRIDVDIEEVMLGRYAIGSEMNRVMHHRPLAESLVGSGPGSANALATLVSDGTLKQPHNDWLRIRYDYGVVGSIIMTTFIAFVFSSSTTGAVIAVTNAVMMVTDNILIYLYYQIPIVLMLSYSAMRECRAKRQVN